MFGRRVLSSFVLASSIALSVRSRAIPENPSSPTICKYDVFAPVTTWLGESCRLDPMNSRQHLPDSEQGVSCHALQQNRKCFPIWQDGDESSELNHESRDATSYKARPIRQIPEQQTLAVGARSISLQWPDKMQHAVFFTDKECHGAGVGRPEFTWHVEKSVGQIAQCESPPAGFFKSVEFMKQDEYDSFSRRMRGQDRQVLKLSWKGFL